MVVLRYEQGRVTIAYFRVTSVDKKYWKVSNNLDDQISVYVAYVTFSCLFKRSTTNVEVRM